MISALDQAGYVVVTGALDAETTSRLCLAFGADGTGTEHVEIDEQTPAHELWLALAEHPAALQGARHVLGEARCLRLHGRNPRPGFGAQGLHPDSPPREAGAPYEVFTLLWMFDAFTEDNGATRVVPGTHLAGRAVPRAYAGPLDRHPQERIVTGPAGSVLMFNGHLWHSGTLNRSQGPRRSCQMVFGRLSTGGAAPTGDTAPTDDTGRGPPR